MSSPRSFLVLRNIHKPSETPILLTIDLLCPSSKPRKLLPSIFGTNVHLPLLDHLSLSPYYVYLLFWWYHYRNSSIFSYPSSRVNLADEILVSSLSSRSHCPLPSQILLLTSIQLPTRTFPSPRPESFSKSQVSTPCVLRDHLWTSCPLFYFQFRCLVELPVTSLKTSVFLSLTTFQRI